MTLVTRPPLPIPTEGTLTIGRRILLAWPKPEEFDCITELRNRPQVRRFFLDPRPIDAAVNREWLATGMRRGEEGLLSIRWVRSDAFLGTIGWTDWDRCLKTACFGRLMVDHHALRRLYKKVDPSYPGVALDAAMSLRDYAFDEMALKGMTTWYFEGNTLAARVNAAIGMVPLGLRSRLRPDGSSIRTVELRLTRRQWSRCYKHP